MSYRRYPPRWDWTREDTLWSIVLVVLAIIGIIGLWAYMR